MYICMTSVYTCFPSITIASVTVNIFPPLNPTIAARLGTMSRLLTNLLCDIKAGQAHLLNETTRRFRVHNCGINSIYANASKTWNGNKCKRPKHSSSIHRDFNLTLLLVCSDAPGIEHSRSEFVDLHNPLPLSKCVCEYVIHHVDSCCICNQSKDIPCNTSTLESLDLVAKLRAKRIFQG